MARISLILSIIAICLSIVLPIYLRQPDVVYVDSGKLLNEYKGMKDARKAYEKKAVSWKANIDTLSTDLQNQIMDYEKNSSRLSNKEKQLTEELIRTKQRQFADYQAAISNQAKQEEQQMTTEVLTQVNAYLKDFGKSRGYRIVLAATNYGNLAYADASLDVTDEVLEGLNKQYVGQ